MRTERDSTFLDSAETNFRVAFAMLPPVLGGTIPTFGLVNLIWGSFYGWPGILFHWLRIPHPLPFDLVFILAWPVFMTWLLGRVGQWVWALPMIARRICCAAFAASLVLVAPVDAIVMAPIGQSVDFEYLPLYVRLLDY